MMNIKKIIALTIVVAGVLLVAAPAKAFYLELPNVLKFWQGAAKAQEAPAEVIAPAPTPSEPAPAPVPVDSMPPRGDEVVGESNPSPAPMPRPEEPSPYVVPMPDSGFGEGQPQSTCRVNGVEMPGSCEQYNNKPMYDGGGQNNMGMQGGGENGENGDNGERDQKMQQQNDARYLKDMQRGANDMSRSLKEFERMMIRYEKKGVVVEQEVKDRLQKAKEMIQTMKNAKTGEELQAIDNDELRETVNSLEETRREIFESAQRLDGMKRGIKGMSSGLKQFERQVAKLTRQKVAVPSELSETLSKIKTLIGVVNKAKTYEEIEEAGVEDIWDLMQTLEEKRQDLEMLARWPQTLKQLNRELKKLEQQLKRDKTIVNRMMKKEIDLTSNYENFNAAIVKLKAVRDDAKAKMAAGDAEGAFDAVENDFFGQMEDVWQYDRVIQTMSNLGRFKADFNRRVAQAQTMIKKLQRAKKDVTEAKDLLAQVKEKGKEILAMIKSKDSDDEDVMSALSELEDVGQEFEALMGELLGESEIMPWETGPQQVQKVQMPTTMKRHIPQKTAEVQQAIQQPKNEMAGESNPSPAP